MKDNIDSLSRARAAYIEENGHRPGRWGPTAFNLKTQKELEIRRRRQPDNDGQRSLREALGKVIISK